MATKKKAPAIEAEIVERLSKGETLRSICQDKHMPVWQAVYQWMDKDEEFSSRIAQARARGHDAIAENAMQIADESPPVDAGGKIDSGYVAWQKNRVWTRLQLLAKWSPKKYGERTAIEHSGKLSLEQLVSASNDDAE
jgi:hypothetical protein